MTAGIYAITNTQTGHRYVGSSKDTDQRWVDHRCDLRGGVHENPRLQNAWNKYGEDTFEFEVIEVLDSLDNRFEREQYWMDQRAEYNIAKVAGCDFGDHNRSLWADPEYRQRGLEQLELARNSPKMVQSCREASLKMWQNEDYRTRHAASMANPETRKKLSESHKGAVWSDERRANHKAALSSPETREKIRQAMVGRVASEETKAKMRATAARKRHLQQVQQSDVG